MSQAKIPFRPHEIELLAHQVIARVQNGQPADDDSLVELKAEGTQGTHLPALVTDR